MTEIERIQAAAVMLFNDAGDLALQLRAAHDDSFPAHWDFSAGGRIEDDENPAVSAARELHEEIGVDAEVEFVADSHHEYEAWNTRTPRAVDLALYKAKGNGPFTIDPKEVDRAEFFPLPTIQAMMNEGKPFHPEFVAIWKEGIIARAQQEPF